jgi:hypothetical protein
MSPLDPQLKNLLRRYRASEPPPLPTSPGFAARAVAAGRRRPAALTTLPDGLLLATALASIALIIGGSALLYRAAYPDSQRPSLISASQFAASRLTR